ncbi:unnamed protein product [Dovyalis caffra]|uniref:Major facilitator superfamily (MFS) profile domain-containing protein n=1 Tax=Dovyalis caffra TaxID=77055 RepID=A0AAV1RR32_9ROSI|nr:unnamed protein product [Dovyalis caffra]
MRFSTRYTIVILTFISTTVFYIERVGFSIAYTSAADAAGVNQSNKGIVLTTFYCGYACSQIPGGWLAQRIGGRRVLLVSFMLWSSICFLVPLEANPTTILVISRILVGVVQGFIFPSIHNVLAQWVPPQERSRSVSLTTSGMYLGAAIATLILPSLVKYKGPQHAFLAEAALGAIWSLLWFIYGTDPPRLEHPRATAAGSGDSFLPIKENEGGSFKDCYNPLEETFYMGSSKMMPYLNMFIFSNIGGVIADHLISKRVLSVTKTRKFLNTFGFIVASLALIGLPFFTTSGGAVFCSALSLGFLALGRAGFAVNHMDIAPRYAGIVMGISNTAGTLAGVIGVAFTGKLLEAAKAAHMELSNPESWTAVFLIPGLLCIVSSILFLLFSTGERIFD